MKNGTNARFYYIVLVSDITSHMPEAISISSTYREAKYPNEDLFYSYTKIFSTHRWYLMSHNSLYVV